MNKQKKQPNSVYLVAQYLLENKLSYIHDMKKKCKCNNVAQRIMQLRNVYGWNIATKLEGYDGRIPVYHYRVVKAGKTPNQYL